MINYSDEIKGMNLWEKVANISAEIGALAKDDEVGKGTKGAYKAISIEKVVTAVGEKMNKYGVVIYPVSQEYIRTDEKIVGVDYKTKEKIDKVNRISDVNVTYDVINIHNPAEKITTVASGTGVDPQDKGVGKAQTYAYKNMLLKLFAIATGDDTDKIHSDEYTNMLYGTIDRNEMLDEVYAIGKQAGYTEEKINEHIIKKGFSLKVFGKTEKDIMVNGYKKLIADKQAKQQ